MTTSTAAVAAATAAEPPLVEETNGTSEELPLLRAFAAGTLRYLGNMGRLAVEVVRIVAPGVVEDPPPTDGAAARAPARRTRRPPASPAPSSQARATILIEAEAGNRGLGVFMVENHGESAVSVPVSVSAFSDPAGKPVRPALTFDPPVVELAAGQQQLVQVLAAVDDSLTPGVRYEATLSLPGLSQTGIPIVVRRRPVRAAKPASDPVPEPGPPKVRTARRASSPRARSPRT